MFYLALIDLLNWMNILLIFTVLTFQIYWGLKFYFTKNEKFFSKLFTIITLSINLICLFFSFWSFLSFYSLEEIYGLNFDKNEGIITIIVFCILSIILNLLLMIYLLVFGINFYLVVENQNTIKLGFWKIEIVNFSTKNKNFYYKDKKIHRLVDQKIKKELLPLIKKQKTN